MHHDVVHHNKKWGRSLQFIILGTLLRLAQLHVRFDYVGTWNKASRSGI